MKIQILALLLAISCGAWIGVAPGYGQNNFRAAFARTNITPDTPQNLLGYDPRQSEGVRDSLYHKVIILDDGSKQFYLVATDLGTIAPVTYDKAAARLQKMFNINRENFWWSNTHTHSAPEVGSPGVIPLFLGDRYQHQYNQTYAQFVEDKLVEAVVEARKKLIPAKLGVGWGFSRANINRRGRDIDNKTFLGENPDAPVDEKIGLLRIETADGKLMALIANYAIHGTVLAISDRRISGDAPGEVAKYVEEQTGAPLLFINGALGNIAPRFSVSVNNNGKKDHQLRQFRKLLGEPILEANRNILGTTRSVKLQTSGITVEIPRRADIKTWPDDMKPYLRTTSTGQALVKFPVQFLTINDEVMFWAAPCELFCEISNEIRSNSPYPYTFYAGITNGTFGYLCTEEEIKLGGYEPTVSPFANDADKYLLRDVSNHLTEFHRKNNR
jgi:neutral ceramidase